MATYKSIKYIIPAAVVEHTDSINALSDVDTTTTAPTDGQTLKWNGTNWVPGDLEIAATQKAIFGFGKADSGETNITNIVSSTGVVAADTTGVGTAREAISATGYGEDKAIFGFGNTGSSPYRTNLSNLVSNTGVVATDSTGVGTTKYRLAAACYGGDKGIFAFGSDHNSSSQWTSHKNLVSNTGVVATDTTNAGTARRDLAAASYGTDKAIFGFGDTGSSTNITNLVSNTGVISSDVTGVGTSREKIGASGYGGNKAIFGGSIENDKHKTNLVSATGIVASDVTGVGESRWGYAGSVYGGDKGIFGFGTNNTLKYGMYTEEYGNFVRLISNIGVVASDSTGAGTARDDLGAAGFSLT